MLVYIVASRPYPEKASDHKFYLQKEDAENALENLPEDLRPHFSIYPALMYVISKIHQCQIDMLSGKI